MARTGHLTEARAAPLLSPVTVLRIAIIVVLVVLWESAACVASILGQGSIRRWPRLSTIAEQGPMPSLLVASAGRSPNCCSFRT